VVWIAVAAVVVVLLGLYGSWAARRLDRLHARIDAAAAGLDAQLKHRAEVAAKLADSGVLSRDGVAAVAPAAIAAAEARGLGHDREAVENALSSALKDVAGTLPAAAPEVAEMVDATTRATFARRFHNDAVRDALVVRRRWVVRLLHLAGHAPRPAYFEVDDAPLAIANAHTAAAPYD
jgi:hypothetical protein